MKKTFQLICAMLVMAGCQDSDSIGDNSSPIEKETIPSRVSILTNDGSSVYHLDVETLQEKVTEYNLTELNGVEANYQSIHFNNTQVSFVYNSHPNYSATLVDISNQSHQSFSFDMTSDKFEHFEGPIFAIVLNNWFLFFTQIGQEEFRDLAVHAIDHRTGEQKKLVFAKGVRTYRNVDSEGDNLLVDFQNEDRERTMARINLSSGEVSTKDFGKSYFAAMNKDRVHVFTCSPDIYEEYDLNDWSLIQSRETNSCTELNWTLGLNNIQFNGSEVLVHLQLSQPSPDPSSPGIFDLSSGEMIEGNVIITKLRYDIGDKYSQSGIKIETYAVDLKSKNIVVGYQREDPNGIVSGGLVFTDFTGEILKDIPLLRSPKKIIITEP